MAGADSAASGNAVPVPSAARAIEAQRLHHRQLLRRGVVTVIVVALVGLLTMGAIRVSRQLRNSWILETAGFRVKWQIDLSNWKSGGVTDVNINNNQWYFRSHHDEELKLLPELLNVESVGLAEYAATEPGLAVLADLPELHTLDLTRLYQLQPQYGSTLTGLNDTCLTPIKNLRKLQMLTLAGNRITDDGLAVIATLSSLESLDLRATDVTDAGLVHLQALKNLKALSLGGTRVTPQGVQVLQSALPGLAIDMVIDPEIERALKEQRAHPR